VNQSLGTRDDLGIATVNHRREPPDHPTARPKAVFPSLPRQVNGWQATLAGSPVGFRASDRQRQIAPAPAGNGDSADCASEPWRPVARRPGTGPRDYL